NHQPRRLGRPCSPVSGRPSNRQIEVPKVPGVPWVLQRFRFPCSTPQWAIEDREKLATTEEKRKGGNLASCPPFLRGGESVRRVGPSQLHRSQTALVRRRREDPQVEDV